MRPSFTGPWMSNSGCSYSPVLLFCRRWQRHVRAVVRRRWSWPPVTARPLRHPSTMVPPETNTSGRPPHPAFHRFPLLDLLRIFHGDGFEVVLWFLFLCLYICKIDCMYTKFISGRRLDDVLLTFHVSSTSMCVASSRHTRHCMDYVLSLV